ncbi:MotA/TolQ/ExbB proton channel family protein [Acetobacteraceae bacterium ESL0709]|nr:MotA/TolQ/ExbB proton channel family protein [Acetobacteraceae bacterium ESL0697]MDF7678855.1 MotA/TolQ/ExbB proton channel family protein [Acetobacteraceae bacterium ESL0709]
MTELFRLSARSDSPSARQGRSPALALILGLGFAASLAPAALAQPAPNYNIQVDASHPETLPATKPAQPPTPAAAPETSATPEGANSVALISDHKAGETPAENPYGLKALWHNGDVIARIVLLILAIMSAGTWIVLIVKLIEQTRLFNASREATRQFWGQGSVQKGVDALKASSPFRYIAETGLAASDHYQGNITQQIDRQSWVALSLRRSVDMIGSRLQTGLAFLGTVGSIAPFVGLFGTVWGIYHALTAIGIAGQATIDKVAGPVGESLIMTAIGLATAVPAVLAYNWLVRRNKAAMERVRNFSSDMHAVLIGGYRHDSIFSETSKSSASPNTSDSKA